jgi:hypothetical protein
VLKAAFGVYNVCNGSSGGGHDAETCGGMHCDRYH